MEKPHRTFYALLLINNHFLPDCITICWTRCAQYRSTVTWHLSTCVYDTRHVVLYARTLFFRSVPLFLFFFFFFFFFCLPFFFFTWTRQVVEFYRRFYRGDLRRVKRNVASYFRGISPGWSSRLFYGESIYNHIARLYKFIETKRDRRL